MCMYLELMVLHTDQLGPLDSIRYIDDNKQKLPLEVKYNRSIELNWIGMGEGSEYSLAKIKKNRKKKKEADRLLSSKNCW